jgi:hypothetical protein
MDEIISINKPNNTSHKHKSWKTSAIEYFMSTRGQQILLIMATEKQDFVVAKI